MKKLMIAAAIVCAAVVSQAAATHWKVNSSTVPVWYDGYNNTGDGYTPAALKSTVVYAIAVDTISQDKLVEAFRGDNFDIANYLTNGGTGSTNANGKMPAANSIVIDRDDVAEGDKAYFYGVILATDANNNKWIYLTDSASNIALDPSKSQSITLAPGTTSKDNYGTAEYSAAGWYTTAVPEPTSGLLLLLGVAGLALRRRRA